MEDRGSLINIWILGTGFLKQMIRIMVGTMVETAKGQRDLEELDQILKLGKDGKGRVTAGTTAPAKGLTLSEIFYQEVDIKTGFN